MSSSSVPQQLLDALAAHPNISVTKFPGAGRGLVATAPLAYGETVFVERPMVVCQAEDLAEQVCYGCLAVLPGGPTSSLASPLSLRLFCSERCMHASDAGFHAMESLAMGGASGRDSGGGGALQAFEAACAAASERFPLMASRIGFARLTAAVTGRRGTAGCSGAPADAAPLPSVDRTAGGGDPEDPGAHASGSGGGGGGGGGGRPVVVVAGDALNDFGALCYANVATPHPAPWVEAHSLLAAALGAAAAEAEAQLLPGGPDAASSASVAAEASGAEGERMVRVGALRAEVAALDVEWYVRVLSTLHVNVFRVGCVLPPSRDTQFGPATSGSAAFMLASLLNHSCEPNIEVVFRRNSSVASFTAARDIGAGEQLFVSYLDEGLPLAARRSHLEFGYGFTCKCVRCVEEEADAATR
ncbi:hypothetical protein FOA52_008163 [Chlamydomonas sp. UWO 241]|nr:hypothetical protein FOA52_008163 [Chlamydomonas sp. UWO 241]